MLLLVFFLYVLVTYLRNVHHDKISKKNYLKYLLLKQPELNLDFWFLIFLYSCSYLNIYS